MIKKFLLFSTVVFSIFLIAQNNDDDDIFVQDKAGYLVLKPSVEKKVKEASIKETNMLLTKFTDSLKANDIYSSDDSFLADQKKNIDFNRENLLITTYINAYNEYPGATTTMGMNWMMSYYISENDRLLNKYYKLALQELTPAMKQRLVESQKKWLAYYENEKKLLFDVHDFGNHNSSLYAKEPILGILANRVNFLFSVYNHEMMGINTYVDKNN